MNENKAWCFCFCLIAAAAVCEAQTYTIATAAGGANPYFLTGAGDGGPATSAALGNPCYDAATDSAGNLYIAAGGLIRKVTPGGIISTVAGGGSDPGEYVPALRAVLAPTAIVIDSAGDILVADTAFGSYRVRKLDTAGVITTIAGGAACCALGDGGPAINAYLGVPYGLALDGAGNLYIAQATGITSRVRKVSTNGTISTVAGGGPCCSVGDGGPATATGLVRPTGVAVDGAGNLYIADTGANRVRKVSGGVITTVAGNGDASTSGDGGTATQAAVDQPWQVVVDPSGNLFISQFYDARVRVVTAAGVIGTAAGDGIAGYSGDGGLGANAELGAPAGVAVGGGGIYIADGNSLAPRVRVLAPETSLASSPSGLSATLDTTTPCTTPCLFTLTPGSQHTIAVSSPQAGSAGTRYAFSSWSDGGAISHSIAPSYSPVTYTAAFQTQYRLTVSASPSAGGSVTPVSGQYYAAGGAVSLNAVPNPGYLFNGWSGDVANSSSAATTVIMGSPQTVAAYFTSNKCDVTHAGAFTVADVQSIVNQALGLAAASSDLDNNGAVNVVDVQIVMDAVLLLGCEAM